MTRHMTKLLVANRGEIAIRVMRAATELGLRTVAVYTFEDRFSLHRFKADEAYLIGPEQGGEPVKGYLNIDDLLAIARDVGCDAVHPGYGFLSENPALARACEKNDVTFVGPTAKQLDMFGDKTTAKQLAKKADVPTLPGTDDALSKPAQIKAAAKKIGFPLIIKASFGGGGRGMRVVKSPDELAGKLQEAQREAGAAFGRPEVFLERYVARAKHIEVQILGDAHGNLVHLWERDCSVQRRHQKVVEVAPAINLPQAMRNSICGAAKRLCAAANYRNAGTVEFLVDLDRDEFFFIEVNPRIQVEHTVTEQITGIDIVKSQLMVAQGHKLHDPPLNIPRQEEIRPRGVAIQCRITTEDPENNFTPDYGRLATYRSAAGFGIRLDAGSAFGGAVITPFFDSLLVKVTSLGTTLDEAARRMDRALREFRVRGVKTNIQFLENVILHPTFLMGAATTTFIDSTAELFEFTPRRDRATKILAYLGDVIINSRPDVKGKVDPNRRLLLPQVPAFPKNSVPPPGTKQKLDELGPAKFAAVGAQAETTAVHRHDDARCASIAAGDAHAHDRHAEHRRSGRTQCVATVQHRNVGRRDVRLGHAVPSGRSVGTTRSPAHAHPEHLLSDAAAREQRRRLHQLSGQRRSRSRRTVEPGGDRYLPHLRLAQRDRQHGSGDGCGAREHEQHLRSRDLLHRRHPRSEAHEVFAEVLRRDGQATRADGHAHPGDQGHGRPVQTVCGACAGESPA